MDNEFAIIVENENGEKSEYELLVEFSIGSAGDEYVVCTDYSRDEDGNFKIICARKYRDKFLPIESQIEWEIVSEYVNNLFRRSDMYEA